MSDTPDPDCIKCHGWLNPKRAALGYRTCIECGAAPAEAEKQRKAQSVCTLHKSGSVYVGTGPSAVQYAKDIARMRRGTDG